MAVSSILLQATCPALLCCSGMKGKLFIKESHLRGTEEKDYLISE
jgi:hypothetical protein